MRTRSERGKLYAPVRILEMLESRFGAFETIAYAALESLKNEPDEAPPMDVKTADAILEFADDLRQAYEAAAEWAQQGTLAPISAHEARALPPHSVE